MGAASDVSRRQDEWNLSFDSIDRPADPLPWEIMGTCRLNRIRVQPSRWRLFPLRRFVNSDGQFVGMLLIRRRLYQDLYFPAR
jgi:hypothetical protein